MATLTPTPTTCPDGCAGHAEEPPYCHCQGCGEFLPDDVVNGYCFRCCDHESWLPGGGPNYGRHGLYCEHCGKYRDDLMADVAQRLDDFFVEEDGLSGYRLPGWVDASELQRLVFPEDDFTEELIALEEDEGDNDPDVIQMYEDES